MTKSIITYQVDEKEMLLSIGGTLYLVDIIPDKGYGFPLQSLSSKSRKEHKMFYSNFYTGLYDLLEMENAFEMELQ